MSSAAISQDTLTIVVAGRDEDFRRFLRETLEDECGYQVLLDVGAGPSLQRAVLQLAPNVVVCDARLPGISALDALRHISQEQPVAAVILAEPHDQTEIQAVLHQLHLTYLLKPVEARHLGPAVRVAWARFTELRELAQANSQLRRNLEDRKVIERAKGVLMKRFRWSEEEAHRRLQRGAMNRRVRLINLAEAVLNGSESTI
jgi:response regulator NasT